jgi:hypothetical protein
MRFSDRPALSISTSSMQASISASKGLSNVVFDPFNDPLLKSSTIEMTGFTGED